jgi:hypothetical protein
MAQVTMLSLHFFMNRWVGIAV